MSEFVVSARKYRPMVFADVLGQTHITTTLQNAIGNDHLAQAFLFCGPRGVGKTTCARILAKTINCEQRTPQIDPCNTCNSCVSFNNGSAMNSYELDAASNNAVEDIRALVEQVRYPPQSGRYKVYIIDEVHMLSSAAFNAFLKTLEEPPRYAIFILATTEKHKILPTIISRCQLFDFHRIQPKDIVQQLKRVAEQEKITYEEEALHLIGQKADGALRDALSIFDVIATFAAGKSVTYKATREQLHVLDYEDYFKLTEAFLQGQIAPVLLHYDKLLRAGFDGQHFIAGLSTHFRQLMVCKDEATTPLLEASAHVQTQYKRQASQTALPFLIKALALVNQCALSYRSSYNQRLHVELTLIALTQIQPPLQSTTPPPTSPPQTPTTQPSPTDTLLPKSSKPSPAPVASTPSPDRMPSTPPKPMHSTLPTTLKIPQIAQIKAELVAQPPAASPTPVKAKPNAPPKPLTYAEVHLHWQAYAQQLKKADKMPEYRLMNQAITLEDACITLTLTNAVQEDTLADIQEQIVTYLRQQLNHPSITLKGMMLQSTRPKKPYTAQEKFQYLAAKYPALRTLQAQLDLEVQA